MGTIASVLNELENTLYTKAQKLNLPVIDEDLGVIIFLSTQYVNTKDEQYKIKALKLFNKTVQIFAEHELNYSLIHGFEGIFWVVNYMTECGILDNEKILKNLEPYLIESIEYDLDRHNYNVLHGCLGKIQYYLYSRSVDSNKAPMIVNKVIKALYENKIEKNGLINWNDQQLNKGLNIGVFNGHPTILKFLVRLKELGYISDQVDEMIDTLITILSKAVYKKKEVSIRGKDIDEENKYYDVSELHGNLSIANSLYYAGLILQREDIKEIAHELALCISSKNPANSGIMHFNKYEFQDIGMSHGLGGITYLLFKLNNWINDSRIQRNIDIWKQEFLKNVEKVLSIDEKIIMPKIFQKDENEYPYDKYSMLEGLLGSGLVLSSLHYNQDNWGNYLTLY